jgi:rhamnose utilization protein RhaD (predicted bifunctional aldolase and dehydrogenase)
MAQRMSALLTLIDLSRRIAEPERDLVILGEGNTSAKIDDDTFWVKASGTSLVTASRSTFVEVALAPVLELLEGPEQTDAQVKEHLQAAKAHPEDSLRPSVETVLHALALTLGGASFCVHTHPTAVNAILCSKHAEEAFAGRLFPDEIVLCGPAPAFVPYTDPGLPLARAIRDAFLRYADEWGEPPKVLLMQNHGLVALGRTAQDAENTTMMLVKTARVITGAYSLGGPHPLTSTQVDRIHTRPDEAYRRGQLR